MQEDRSVDPRAISPDAQVEEPRTDLDAAMRKIFPEGVPNLYRMLMRNSAVMAGLAGLKLELAKGRLTAAEHGLVALEVAREADCAYCLGALRHHLSTALEVSERNFCESAHELPTDPRARLIVSAARSIIAARGRLSQYEIGRFSDQGLVLEDLIEIVAVVGEYTIATYSANLDRTRLDPEYRAVRVSPPQAE